MPKGITVNKMIWFSGQSVRYITSRIQRCMTRITCYCGTRTGEKILSVNTLTKKLHSNSTRKQKRNLLIGTPQRWSCVRLKSIARWKAVGSIFYLMRIHIYSAFLMRIWVTKKMITTLFIPAVLLLRIQVMILIMKMVIQNPARLAQQRLFSPTERVISFFYASWHLLISFSHGHPNFVLHLNSFLHHQLELRNRVIPISSPSRSRVWGPIQVYSESKAMSEAKSLATELTSIRWIYFVKTNW